MRTMLKLLVLGLMLLLLGGGLYALAKRGNGGGPGSRLVEVTLGSITEKALAVGTIEPKIEYQVKSKISGIVKECYVEVGDVVKRGDPLFLIAPDPTPRELVAVRHDLEVAAASLARAEAELKRGEKLFSEGLMPKAELEKLEEAYKLAKASYQRALENLELATKGKVSGEKALDTVIRAPGSGTILTRNVDPGDPVVPLTSYQPGTELATIAPMDELIFKGTVDEIDVGKVRVGMQCKVEVGALPGVVVDGVLSRIAPKAERKEGSTRFDVEVELDPPEGVLLRAGYSANARILVATKDNIPLLPERVLVWEGDKPYVLLWKGEGVEPEKVELKIGLSDGLNVEVLEPLKPGDKVLEPEPKEVKNPW